MPLQRTSDTDVERIPLTDPDEWIEVKRKLGKDDERRRTSMLLRGQMVRAGESITVFDAGASLAFAPFATLFTVAKKWNVKDPETGRVAALTEGNMQALSDEDMALINAAFERLYAEPLSEEALKN